MRELSGVMEMFDILIVVGYVGRCICHNSFEYLKQVYFRESYILVKIDFKSNYFSVFSQHSCLVIERVGRPKMICISSDLTILEQVLKTLNIIFESLQRMTSVMAQLRLNLLVTNSTV